MAGQFNALHVDILGAVEFERIEYSEAAKELRHIRLAATPIVFAENAGVLRGSSGGDGRVGATVGIALSVAPDIGGIRSVGKIKV